MNEQNNKQVETLTDKAFLRLAITSLLTILLLIAGLCSTTYAWFVQDISSSENQLTSAKCDLEVTLSDGTSVLMEASCGTNADMELPIGTYTVTLTLPTNSASGYLIVKIGEAVYHTDFLSRHTDTEAHTLVFTLELHEESRVILEPRWGIYSGEPDVRNGDVLSQ